VVDVEHQQRRVGDLLRDVAGRLDLGEVAYAAQQRLAIRGVPRERRAISSAPPGRRAP
jgi:hypothetical protein